MSSTYHSRPGHLSINGNRTGTEIPREIKEVTLLSFIANVASPIEGTVASIEGKKKYIESKAYDRIKAIFDANNYPKLNEYMGGEWDLTWGPAVYIDQAPFEAIVEALQIESNNIADHVTFMAKKPNPNNNNYDTYVIATSGTNGGGSYLDDWLQHNLNISQQTWPYAEDFDTDVKVSSGALSGLNHILSTRSTLPKDANKNILEALKQEIAKSDKDTIYIHTAGHSMGGALSPVLAMYLFDQQRRWNPENKKVHINCVSVAGYSVGNQAFATRYTTEDGVRINRIYNPRDVVPYVWRSSDLANLPFLHPELNLVKDLIYYNLQCLALNDGNIFKGLVDTIVKCIADIGNDNIKTALSENIQKLIGVEYQHISGGIRLTNTHFKQSINPKDTPVEQYIGQIDYQHVNAYIDSMFGHREKLHQELNDLVGLVSKPDPQTIEKVMQILTNLGSRVAAAGNP